MIFTKKLESLAEVIVGRFHVFSELTTFSALWNYVQLKCLRPVNSKVIRMFQEKVLML